MTETNTTPEATVEPIAWFARRSTIAVASVAVVALVASIVVGVSASQARAADADARDLITASVSDAKAARTACTTAVASSTASVDTAAYVAAITDALGADSEAAKAAATSHDKPYVAADCAIIGAIAELSADEDPSDNVDAITASNTTATAAWVALATDVKALDKTVASDLAALSGLADANAVYTVALTSLQDAINAVQALTEGDLAVYLGEDGVATLNGARDSAQQVLDIAVSSLDVVSPMSLNNRATTLDEAVAALAATVDPLTSAATDAKATADSQAAAEAAAAEAAAAEAARLAAANKPRSSGSTSSSAGSTGNGSTGSTPPASTGGAPAADGQHIWTASGCPGHDMLKWVQAHGWTESDARADALAKGCLTFNQAR